MSRQFYFEHHFVEARRNRFRLGVAVVVIFLAAGLFMVPSLGSLASDTAPPTTPASMQAVLNADSSAVVVSWAASTDATGVSSYLLERSVDQTSWGSVARIQSTTYTDTSVVASVRYFYRVSALDAAGNASGYAKADARTSDAGGVSDAGSISGTYTSDDDTVSVNTPDGAFSENATCRVETPSKKLGKQTRTVIAGPYQLSCTNSSGELLTNLLKPISWKYDLKAVLKKLADPTAISVDANGDQTDVKGANYDSKTKTLYFDQAQLTTTAVVASKPAGVPGNLIALLVFVALVVVGVFTLILRKSQKQSYNEYLRKKYYNL